MNIGIIGNWGHHVGVLEELESMSDLQVAGLTSSSQEEDICFLREKYPEAKVFAHHHEMLRKLALDLVIISTRLDKITSLAIDAANAGCHTICEKPLALKHGDLEMLWNTVMTRKTQCLIMLPNCKQPVLRAAKILVDSGRIGEVKLLNARKSYKCLNKPHAWIGRRDTYGGTLPWVGIHALDFIQIISGCGFSSVSAQHANVNHDLQPEREDIATMSLKLTNGSLATASIDYLRPQSAPSHGDDWLRIVGTRGSLEASMERNSLVVIDADGVQEITGFPAREAHYLPLLQMMPKPGESKPNAETRKGFALTHVALCGRDAADNDCVITNLRGPWDA